MKYFPATARTVIERPPFSPASRCDDPIFPGTDRLLAPFPTSAESHPWVRPNPVLPAALEPADSSESDAEYRIEVPIAPVLPEQLRRFSAWSRARVLLVDDNAGVIDLTTQVLEGAGFQVCSAGDGESAWARWNQSHFDLLITDHAMPLLSGVELLRRLRAAGSAVPAILLSGRAPVDAPDLDDLLRPGGRLMKPFALARLLALVGELLTHGEQAKARDTAARSRDTERHATLFAPGV